MAAYLTFSLNSALTAGCYHLGLIQGLRQLQSENEIIQWIAGHCIGVFTGCTLIKPLCNRIEELAKEWIINDETREKIAKFVPIVSIGLTTLVAHAAYNRSSSTFNKGCIVGIHSIMLNLFQKGCSDENGNALIKLPLSCVIAGPTFFEKKHVATRYQTNCIANVVGIFSILQCSSLGWSPVMCNATATTISTTVQALAFRVLKSSE